MSQSRTKPKKYKSSDYYIIECDDNDKTVMFRLPMAALFYDTDKVTLKSQDRIDDALDELKEVAEMYCDTNLN